MSLYPPSGNSGTLPVAFCAHDGTATGRSRLGDGKVHLEVVCEGCGNTIRCHGQEDYKPDPALGLPIRPVQ